MTNYYDNINLDLLNRIPVTSTRVLEIGCGSGRLGQAFKARVPGSRYYGVEVVAAVAKQARPLLDGIVCLDIEQDVSRVEELANTFDALVFGDVLEHLQDPWRVLRELRAVVEPNGVCVACIPNVAHWSLLAELLKGKWNYADQGLLDRTHLRFFTLDSAAAMLEQAGWTVMDAKPRKLHHDRSEEMVQALLPSAMAMGMTEAKARQNLTAFQWVIRAVNGPVPRSTTVAAVGSKKVAGVTEARIDHPMRALSSLPSAKVFWREASLTLPDDVPPGVLVLHRELMTDAKFNAQMAQLIAKGWLLVLDMDDDPNHWDGYVSSDFYAFKAVHAVTVSTPHLADVIRPFNPNVQVFENAILQLPLTEKNATQAHKLRIFFGALNRQADWQAVIEGINQAALAFKDNLEFVVVHDQAFYDALPVDVAKTFLPTLGIEKYTETLASCDIALLPLNDTPFNQCKSDLKLIECAAAEVAVICSEVVYAQNPKHVKFVTFATRSDDWRETIIKLVTDEKYRKSMTKKGRLYVQKNRMHAQQAAARQAFYQSLLDNKTSLEAQRVMRLSGLREGL